jgi:site-specific DNA recombinase
MIQSTNVAFYARVSSQKQADDRTIQSQCDALCLHIKNEGLTIPEENKFCDDGFSGSTMVRPALERLRDLIHASVIDRLYIHSPDRLSRSMIHSMILLDEFQKNGCEVVFLNQLGIPDSPERSLLLQMQGMIGEFERSKILERTRRGRRHAASCGSVSVLSRTPYGYQYVDKANGDGVARWDVDPERSKHVRLMFELVGNQGNTLSSVVVELQKREIPSPKGHALWSVATICGILRNPAYHGKAIYGRTRLTERKPGKRAGRGRPTIPKRGKVQVPTSSEDQIVVTVPSIVERSLFDQVGKQLDENRKRQREWSQGATYLLSGLTICGKCGSAYCSRSSPDGRNSYYRCISSDKYRNLNRPICDNTSVKTREIEAAVWKELCKLLQEPLRLSDELSRRKEAPNDAQKRHELEEDLKKLQAQHDRLVDAYVQGHLAKNEFERRATQLRERREREEALLQSMLQTGHEQSDIDDAQNALNTLAADVKNNLATADYSLKRNLLTLLIKQIEIHADEIRIVYKVPQVPFVRVPDKRGFLQHCCARPGDR